MGAIATPINYDILSYLPQELDSRVGQLLLETDYHLASTNMITVEGMPTNELLAMKAEIDEVLDVLNTFWLSDVLDPAVPTEMCIRDSLHPAAQRTPYLSAHHSHRRVVLPRVHG